MEGWIKLHRKIIESTVFDNPGVLKTWLWCLCKATYTKREAIVGRQTVTLLPGQFIFGRKSAGIELNINDRTVYDYMKLLEKIGCISLNPNNKYTVVTIENWGVYQDCTDEHQQQTDNKYTTEQQENSNKCTTDGHKQESKEREKVKNNKNNIITPYIPPKGGDPQPLTLTSAILIVKKVSEKRGFSLRLQDAFTRWITYKYNIGDTFKNEYAIDKVGQAIESHAFVQCYGIEDRSERVIQFIDYCISINSKSLCWSRISEIKEVRA